MMDLLCNQQLGTDAVTRLKVVIKSTVFNVGFTQWHIDRSKLCVLRRLFVNRVGPGAEYPILDGDIWGLGRALDWPSPIRKTIERIIYIIARAVGFQFGRVAAFCIHLDNKEIAFAVILPVCPMYPVVTRFIRCLHRLFSYRFGLFIISRWWVYA